MVNKSRWITSGVIITIIIGLFSFNLSGVKSQDPAPQKIESDAAQVTRTGNWSSQATTSASGGSYLYNSPSTSMEVGSTDEDALSLEFSGTTLEILYVSGPSLGTLAIEVDGTVLRTVITRDTETRYGQSTVINYLTDEPHTLKVYAQEGGIIAVDAFIISPSVGGVGSEPSAPDTLIDQPTDPDFASIANILINEVDAGSTDRIELFNPTNAPVNMTGWVVQTFGATTTLDTEFILPTFTLQPGAYVIINENAGTNTATTLFQDDNMGFEFSGSGAVRLLNPLRNGVDFVRWNDSLAVPAPPDIFTGDVGVPDDGRNLGRAEGNDDDDIQGDWETQCPTLGGINDRCLVLNEFFHGSPDAVEIFNASSQAINLSGYQFTAYSTVNSNNGTFVFPSHTIQPGGYVILRESTGTPSGNVFFSGFNFAWNDGDGGGELRTNTNSQADFFQWGTVQILTPPNWIGTGIIAAGEDFSQARQSSGFDGNWGGDFCPQESTLGVANPSCLVISEIFGGDPEYIELHNNSAAPYPIGGLNLDIFNDATTTPLPAFVLPTHTIPAGGYVRIVEGSGSNSIGTIFMNTGNVITWTAGQGGAVRLEQGAFEMDLVRFGGSLVTGGDGSHFLSPNPPPIPAGNNLSIARHTSGTDFDEGGDWCVQRNTPSTRNHGCNARLAIFLAGSAPHRTVTLIDSLTNPAPPNAYNTYTMQIPTAATNGQWVMGDWDGDGDKTPGFYGNNGVFYHTNNYGPTTTWTETWFGLLTGVAGNRPVVGRFLGANNHDCLGVVDSQNFPPFGVAFALYFTCNMNGGDPAKTLQWLSILLPDNQGHSGTFQFAAGDFDNNGIDSIAARRGQFITFTNTNPNTVNGTFPNAQFWGVPPGMTGHEGSFVVGDWDNDGFASFGAYYPAFGLFYFRNDLLFNSGAYGAQQSTGAFPATATAASWEGY